jgi:hypothetical protein
MGFCSYFLHSKITAVVQAVCIEQLYNCRQRLALHCRAYIVSKKIVEDLYTNTHSFPIFPYATSIKENKQENHV